VLDGLDEPRRALASEEPARRKWARDQLRGHDETSARAVPFLLELVADPATPERNLILLLLDGMSVGEDDFVLPEGVRVGFEALPTYRAVREGVPLFRKLLWDGDTEIEAQAAKLLAWFPSEADGSLEALWARLEKAPQTVAGACLAAIGLLGGRHQVERLAPLLTDDDPYRRWGAAIALARIAGRDAPDPALDVLLDAATGDLPDGTDEGVEFDNGDMPGYAIRSLRLLGPRGLDAMLEALPGCERLEQGVMEQVFPERIERETLFADLTDDQQRVLRAVLRSGWVTGWRLRNLGLPETAEDLDAYIRGVRPRRKFWRRR
jgi:HEAT repeat protein